MSDGYERQDYEGPRRWQIHDSPESSSSHTPPSRAGSSSTYEDEEEEAESVIVVPPNVPAWNVKRHSTAGNPAPIPESVTNLGPWRNRDNKNKTQHAALVLCLNIGVDPPDVVKTNPCAVLECWIDPFSLPPSKALEQIGRNLVHQFDTLNPRIKYKHYADPCVEDARRFCAGLRKLAKEDRALFYYNGHGVPKPTSSGEIWVFNRTYTQYIPVSLHELQGWLGNPTTYVWDCSAAGHILENYEKFARKRDVEFYQQHPDPKDHVSYTPFVDSIHFAPCASDENLPMAPELPADVFTSALTSPIEMALRFHVLQNQARLKISVEDAMQTPGDLKDRKTPLGELNWIYTAITDTIAWTTLPKDLFKRLFRQDWTLNALFRNFLLAERILRKYNCTPRTFPALPPAHMHPLWSAWDLAVDKVLVQLPKLIAWQRSAPPIVDGSALPTCPFYEKVAGPFYEEHLQAFFVWLNRGGSGLTKSVAQDTSDLPVMARPPLADEEVVTQRPNDVIATTTGRAKPTYKPPHEAAMVPRKPPDQLPTLLQVLLSTNHRLRALILLGNFLDLGPWAVHLALSIGIFPYAQKLLQSQNSELRPVLIYIWSRMVAFDQEIQVDLYEGRSHTYFYQVLRSHNTPLAIPNEVEHKAMCAFVLAIECRDFPDGQDDLFDAGVLPTYLWGLGSEDYLMRQWCGLAVALLWDGYDEVKSYAFETLRMQNLLEQMILDDAAEVRAAMFYAYSTLFGCSASAKKEKCGGGGMGCMSHLGDRDLLGLELKLCMAAILTGKDDASPMVRKEVVVLLSALVNEWKGWFVVAAWAYWEGSRVFFKDMAAQSLTGRQRRSSDLGRRTVSEDDTDIVWSAIEHWIDGSKEGEEIKAHNHVVISTVFILFASLLELTVDPYPEVANMAKTISDYLLALLKGSAFARLPTSTLHSIPPKDAAHASPNSTASPTSIKSPALSVSTSAKDKRTSQLNESTLSGAIKRTSSIASSIRNIAAGYAFPTVTEKDPQDEGINGVSTDDYSERKPTLDPHPPRLEFKALKPLPRMPGFQYISPYGNRSFTGDSSLTSSTRVNGSSLNGSRHSLTSSKRGPAFHLDSGPVTPAWSRRTSPERSGSMNISPVDIIEALVAEDWERLRIRRQEGQHQEARRKAKRADRREQFRQQALRETQARQQQSGVPGRPTQPPPAPPQRILRAETSNPPNGENGHEGSRSKGMDRGSGHANGLNSSWTSSSSESFVTTDSSESESRAALGIANVSGVVNPLPLKSRFFDWSMEYFTEPQMRAAENEEPGSVVYNEQSWRARRNEKMIADTTRQGPVAANCKWDKALSTLQTTHPVRLLKFHRFENHLITANHDRIVSVWDWAKRKRIACFDNGNPDGTSVTSLQFINEDVQTQLLTGSADGIVRIFSNYDPETAFDDHPLELCSAFRALPRLSPSNHPSGMVTDWLQPFGLLVAGGDSRVIRVWDAHKETVSADIATESDSCITALTADVDAASLIIAGMGDGCLSVYDRRTSRVEIRMKQYRMHESWIQQVHWQRGSEREILSGSLDGRVNLWDVRSAQGSLMQWNPHPSGLANFAVHDHAAVFASTSALGKGPARMQDIIVQSLPPVLDPPILTLIQVPIHPIQTSTHTPYSPFLPSPGSLAFHPHEMLFGWGGGDGRIKLYGCNIQDILPERSPSPDVDERLSWNRSPPSTIDS